MPAPDLIEPIIGFRAWRVSADGKLLAWSAARGLAWEPGVNSAVCLVKPHVPSHVAPMHRCSCGLYALTNPHDARLQPGVLAVGAIIAWGELELHATGFRAQSALIVALGRPPDCDPVHLRRLERAAERYGVPLVPLSGLRATAGEYGRMADPQWVVRPHVAGRDNDHPPRPSDIGASGIAIDEHLQVDVAADGVRIALAGALLGEVLGRPEPLVAPGTVIARGDVLFRAAARGGAVELVAPLSGEVAQLPGSGRTLVVLDPTRWRDEMPEISWGPRAPGRYAHDLAHAAQHGDPFAHLRAEWRARHAHVGSARDVLEALQAARGLPRFASERDVDEQIGGRLRQALADPVVARRVLRMRARICWRLHAPDADLLIDLTGDTPRVARGVAPAPGDLVLFAAAEVADDHFAGRVDIAAALRRREIQSSAPLANVLLAASVLKALTPAYAALAPRRAKRFV